MIDIQIKNVIGQLERIRTEMIRQHARLNDRRCVDDTIRTLERLAKELK